MKKEIYSESGYQHGLFSRDNFKQYIRETDETLFISGFKDVSTGTFFASYHLGSSGLVLSYLKAATPAKRIFEVTVSLIGNKRKIGGVEKKILKDATRFKEDQKRVRRHLHTISGNASFGFDYPSDSPDANYD